MKKIKDYTIKELLEMGARVDISVHQSETMSEAMWKLNSVGIKEAEVKEVGTTKWLQKEEKRLEVSSFYGEKE